jgi:hypothetical protein
MGYQVVKQYTTNSQEYFRYTNVIAYVFTMLREDKLRVIDANLAIPLV